jgi:hypothetical protein
MKKKVESELKKQDWQFQAEKAQKPTHRSS